MGEVIREKNMPKARKPSSVTDSDVGNTEPEVMAVKFIGLLNDEDVLRKSSALYPQALTNLTN